MVYAATTLVIIYWNPYQPFVIHISHHVLFNEYGALSRYSEFMNTCHSMNIIVQSKGGDEFYLNNKGEIPNKKLANITIAFLLN